MARQRRRRRHVLHEALQLRRLHHRQRQLDALRSLAGRRGEAAVRRDVLPPPQRPLLRRQDHHRPHRYNALVFPAADGGHTPQPPSIYTRALTCSAAGVMHVPYVVGAADALGIPFLTPYLAGNKSGDYAHGANFAVGGATALGRGYFRRKKLDARFTPYSLRWQMRWLKKVLVMVSSQQGTPIALPWLTAPQR